MTEQEESAPEIADTATALSQEEKNWGMFCHIAVFTGFLIPFGNLLAPLVLWLMKKDEMPYVDYHGKEVLNFQITVLIAVFVAWLLIFVVIGVFLMVVIGLFTLVVTIIGLIKASQGEYYRYPFSLRLIK